MFGLEKKLINKNIKLSEKASNPAASIINKSNFIEFFFEIYPISLKIYFIFIKKGVFFY